MNCGISLLAALLSEVCFNSYQSALNCDYLLQPTKWLQNSVLMLKMVLSLMWG